MHTPSSHPGPSSSAVRPPTVPPFSSGKSGGSSLCSPDSYSIFAVPSQTAQELFFYLQEAGYFHTLWPYRTLRQDLDSFLIVYTISGRGRLEYREQACDLTAGSCFFIDCKEPQHYFTTPQEPWKFLWLHFQGWAAPGYFREFMRSGSAVFQTSPSGSRIESLIRRCIDLHLRKDAATEALTSQLITALLTELLLGHTVGQSPEMPMPPLIEEAARQIRQNFAGTLLLDELSGKLHISKFHLIREFTRFLGVSPHEYQIELRLSHAKELLRCSDTPIHEIAALCGFGQTSHFIQLFKSREGITPLQFRKQWMG